MVYKVKGDMKYSSIAAGFLASCLFFTHLQAYQYDFAVCAVFQNEARFLKEWIEYHKIVGAQHFYLYNNDSHDNYLKVLQPYIDDGSVDLVEWHVPDFQHSGQQRAYLDAINKTKDSVKWLAVIDLDEFIVPKVHDSVPAWLAEYENEGVGGVGINWQMFGTSYVPKIERNQLLTEKLTLKAQENHSENIHIKSIVRPKYVVEPVHIHHFEYSEGYSQVNANHEAFTGPFSPYVTTDKIQINHYWTKDEEFLYETKIPRRQEWGETMGSIENRVIALNQVEDTSIARFLPQLRQQMFPSETWEEIKPLKNQSDLQNTELTGPRFVSAGYPGQISSGESMIFGQAKGSDVSQLIAELGESGQGMLPLEDPSLYNQEGFLKPYVWFMLVLATLGTFYLSFRYVRVQRVASETPH